MSNTVQAGVGHEWAMPHFRAIRALRLAAMGLSLGASVLLESHRPAHLLEEPAFIAGVIALCLVTAMTFLPGFKVLEPWMMTTIPLLDIAVIGVFSLIPGVGTGSAVIAALPAMWLGGSLGKRGILVAAGASTLFVMAPNLYFDGFTDHRWSEAVSITLFATIAASGMALSTQMWAKQVLQLEEQEQSLRGALAVKDDFVALVSHELRTPLTSIIGYLDLASHYEDDMPVAAVTHLGAVSRNADRLLLLVTDLLAAHASEVTPMRLAIETVDVGALARLSADDIEKRAREGGLSLECHLPPGIQIQADPNRLLQIIDNLLSNALKFTPPGGHIFLAVRREPGGVALTVTDTGIGMDELSLASLGTKFFRSPQATASAIPGIGLGLTITKTIVEAHGGQLTFASQEGAGTSVAVHLPDVAPSVATPKAPTQGAVTTPALPRAA